MRRRHAVVGWEQRGLWLRPTMFGAAVVLLAVEPTPLVPLARAVLAICERLPVLSVITGHAPPLLLAFLLAVAAVFGVSAMLSAVVGTAATLRFNRSLDEWTRPLPSRLRREGYALGIASDLVYLDLPSAQAFCFGFARPRVAVTRGLLELLGDAELSAVLAHERRHLEQRDPIRYLMVDALVAGAFMVPLAGALRHRVEVRIELAADQAALRVAPRKALAGALLAVLRSPSPSVPGLAGLSATEARIAQLAGRPALPPIPSGAVVATVALVAIMVGVAGSLAMWADPVTPHCLRCMGG